MSTRDFTANVISATKVVPDGNFKDSKASGIWDINEALDLIKGGNWPNAANVNPAAFVDALFSTDLYVGNGGAKTITNDINLSNSGGLVWTKTRSVADNHRLTDTARGAGKGLDASNNYAEWTANPSAGSPSGVSSFNSNGFVSDLSHSFFNNEDVVSWTFRKQPKFFDVVTYTGNGNSSNTISHNLGSIPGFVVVKRTNDTGDWHTAARQSNGSYIHGNASYPTALNLTSAGNAVTSTNGASDMSLTSTTFDAKKINGYNSHNGSGNLTNINGATYVAYLFAHHDDDGGFGAAGDQDIIKCGSYTGNGNATGPVVDLGFEPQWLLVKDATSTNDWFIWDVMRGFPANVANSLVSLNPNTADAEQAEYGTAPQPTGFQVTDNNAAINTNNNTYIYMAIRRGGMQTPTAASSVFSIDTIGSGAPYFDSNHIVDMALVKSAGASGDWYNYARPIGEKYLATNTTAAEASASEAGFDFMDGHIDANWGGTDAHSWMWKRARGYFDVVAYKGTGTAGLTVNHNLGVAPEMTWVKRRDSATNWRVNVAALGTDGQDSPSLRLNLNNAAEDDNGSYFGNNNSGGYSAPTSSVLTFGGHGDVNASGGSYIAYLFATVAGVSKIGTYTGNDGTTNVDCGFTNGASFVLIKKTNGNNNWFVFDSTRGMGTGNTPSLKLDTTEAEDDLGARDIIDPLAAGFTVNANRGGVNDNGDTFIFYAIAAIS